MIENVKARFRKLLGASLSDDYHRGVKDCLDIVQEEYPGVAEITLSFKPKEAGISVWVTTDKEGSNVIAGHLHTNDKGQVTFYLDVGFYYAWAQKSGLEFSNPRLIEVVDGH